MKLRSPLLIACLLAGRAAAQATVVFDGSVGAPGDAPTAPLPGGGVDYRMQRMKGAQVYYAPLSEETEDAMQTAWQRLTDLEKGETVILELKGRHVIVPQSAKGVARFTFDDLCRMPLGAADYLKVAITYHTVLIDNIPELAANMRNEAKRFVTLIDALYEKKVKLIASAETEPAGIYPDGDGSFEFERTASRLEEMRSEEYLSLSHGG